MRNFWLAIRIFLFNDLEFKTMACPSLSTNHKIAAMTICNCSDQELTDSNETSEDSLD